MGDHRPLVAAAAGLLAAAALLAGEPERDVPRDALAPMLEEYCAGCHTGGRAKGGFDVAAPRTDAVVRKLRVRLKRRDMPPEGEERPSDAEYDAALAALPLPPVPRVTMRRLNRVEYENTVRDLLAVDYDASVVFPPDEVGEGFDNVGDVLSLPPALLEKYLTAAETIARSAVVDEERGRPMVRRFHGDALRFEGGGRRMRDGGVHFFSHGVATGTATLPRDGAYRVRVRAWGQQAGPEKAQVAFVLDDREIERAFVPAEAAAPGTYETTVRAAAGARRFGAAFTNDYYRPDDPDPRQRDRNLAIVWIEIEGPLDDPELPPSQRAILPRPPPRDAASAAHHPPGSRSGRGCGGCTSWSGRRRRPRAERRLRRCDSCRDAPRWSAPSDRAAPGSTGRADCGERPESTRSRPGRNRRSRRRSRRRRAR
jgi:hypothetical protein